MTKKFFITRGKGWDSFLPLNQAHPIIDENSTHVTFQGAPGDEKGHYYGYPDDDPNDEYSLYGEVIDWPEVEVGDKIKATRGENVLVGHVVEVDEELQLLTFEVGTGSEDWYLTPAEGFSVELLETARVTRVTYPPGTLVHTGALLVRLGTGKWVHVADGRQTGWTDEVILIEDYADLNELIFQPGK